MSCAAAKNLVHAIRNTASHAPDDREHAQAWTARSSIAAPASSADPSAAAAGGTKLRRSSPVGDGGPMSPGWRGGLDGKLPLLPIVLWPSVRARRAAMSRRVSTIAPSALAGSRVDVNAASTGASSTTALEPEQDDVAAAARHGKAMCTSSMASRDATGSSGRIATGSSGRRAMRDSHNPSECDRPRRRVSCWRSPTARRMAMAFARWVGTREASLAHTSGRTTSGYSPASCAARCTTSGAATSVAWSMSKSGPIQIASSPPSRRIIDGTSARSKARGSALSCWLDARISEHTRGWIVGAASVRARVRIPESSESICTAKPQSTSRRVA